MRFVCPAFRRSPFFHVQSEDMPEETLKCCLWTAGTHASEAICFLSAGLFMLIFCLRRLGFPCLSTCAIIGYNIFLRNPLSWDALFVFCSSHFRYCCCSRWNASLGIARFWSQLCTNWLCSLSKSFQLPSSWYSPVWTKEGTLCLKKCAPVTQILPFHIFNI